MTSGAKRELATGDQRNPTTNEDKFTPGPWVVDGDGIHAIVRGADLTIVAKRHRHLRSEHEANARLIAAAPDMLKALKEISRNAAISDSWLKPVLAAIAKAEGRAS